MHAAEGDRLRVAETFHSLQGEGGLIGTPSFFIRTSGCNLRCQWCDTPYASWETEGEWRTVAELTAAVPVSVRHVVVTGGEPMLWPNLPLLTAALRRAGRHVTIETAGTVFQSLECDLMSVSPKLANSDPTPERPAVRRDHAARRIDRPVLARLLDAYRCQLKFVIAEPGDLAEVQALLGELPPVDPGAVFLMPLGATAAELAGRAGWLAELCKECGYRFAPRLQVDLFGAARGT